jgi:hypothetical protein
MYRDIGEEIFKITNPRKLSIVTTYVGHGMYIWLFVYVCIRMYMNALYVYAHIHVYMCISLLVFLFIFMHKKLQIDELLRNW